MNQISRGKIVKFGREAKILFIRLKKGEVLLWSCWHVILVQNALEFNIDIRLVLQEVIEKNCRFCKCNNGSTKNKLGKNPKMCKKLKQVTQTLNLHQIWLQVNGLFNSSVIHTRRRRKRVLYSKAVFFLPISSNAYSWKPSNINMSNFYRIAMCNLW